MNRPPATVNIRFLSSLLVTKRFSLRQADRTKRGTFLAIQNPSTKETMPNIHIFQARKDHP